MTDPMMFPPPSGYEDLFAQIEDYLQTPDWPYETVEVDGDKWEIRRPRPESLRAFVAAVIPAPRSKEEQAEMIAYFVQHHTSANSYASMLYRLVDPDDDFDAASMGAILRAIARLGTARPTVPSHK